MSVAIVVAIQAVATSLLVVFYTGLSTQVERLEKRVKELEGNAEV